MGIFYYLCIKLLRIMISIIIQDIDLEELAMTGHNHKYKAFARNKRFMEGLSRVLFTIHNAESTASLGKYSFLHYEKLRNLTEPLSSVRVVNGMPERLLFREAENAIEITIIELNTDHYGNKK